MALDYITKRFNDIESKQVIIGYKLVRIVDNISFAPAHRTPESAKDFYRYNNWTVANTSKNIATNKLVRIEEEVVTGSLFKKRKTITTEAPENYVAGFHCYLDKEEGYEAFLDTISTRWNSNSCKLSLKQLAECITLLPCKCTGLICEGMQDGHRVIVAKKNYVFNTQEIPLNIEEDTNLNLEEIENEEVT